MTPREKFSEYFEEETGWEPSEHPDKQYVQDLFDAYMKGREDAFREAE